jgi:hypothetical protein
MLQGACRLNAFPGGSDLDQHSIARNALRRVQSREPLSTGDGRGRVEAQSRIDFRGHAPWHHAQDLATKAHQHAIHDGIERFPTVCRDDLRQQRRVLGLAHGLEDQRRIRRRIAWRERSQLPEVAGVGNDRGVDLELLELAGHAQTMQ